MIIAITMQTLLNDFDAKGDTEMENNGIWRNRKRKCHAKGTENCFLFRDGFEKRCQEKESHESETVLAQKRKSFRMFRPYYFCFFILSFFTDHV